MQRVTKEIINRSLIPSSAAVIGTVLFTLIYNRSVAVGNPFWNDVAVWSGLIGMILCTFISPLIIYIFGFFKGAGFGERVIASLSAPVLKSFMILSSFFGIFSVGEVLLLLIHHCILAPVVFAFLEIGLASIVCHSVKKKRSGDAAVKILFRRESVFLLIGIALFAIFFWRLGHFYYFWFLDLYIKLFG